MSWINNCHWRMNWTWINKQECTLTAWRRYNNSHHCHGTWIFNSLQNTVSPSSPGLHHFLCQVGKGELCLGNQGEMVMELGVRAIQDAVSFCMWFEGAAVCSQKRRSHQSPLSPSSTTLKMHEHCSIKGRQQHCTGGTCNNILTFSIRSPFINHFHLELLIEYYYL